jgi:hypothetical protein
MTDAAKIWPMRLFGDDFELGIVQPSQFTDLLAPPRAPPK